jgi:hypothetical protein
MDTFFYITIISVSLFAAYLLLSPIIPIKKWRTTGVKKKRLYLIPFLIGITVCVFAIRNMVKDAAINYGMLFQILMFFLIYIYIFIRSGKETE